MPHFRKYHGLGNDYLVIDPVDWPHPMTPEAVRLICDRHTGVGSDGILHGPFQKNGRLSLRIYNPDGSIAEKSGNGIRIFSRFLQERAYVTAATFELDTDGGTVSVAYQEGPERLIRVNMGRVRFNSHAIPMTGPDREVIDEVLEADGQSFRVTAVSIGNPHCVVRSDDISEAAVRALGPLFENHAVFPERTNVQFLRVRDRHAIEIGIWERGAGFTLASGSSSCAATMAAHRLGLVDSPVTVHMPGGQLLIEGTPDAAVWMTGPVQGVHEGAFHPQLVQALEHVS